MHKDNTVSENYRIALNLKLKYYHLDTYRNAATAVINVIYLLF